MARETVAVALSGGVDSATAAALLVEEGCRVIGLSMRLYSACGEGTRSGRCCGASDLADAERVARHLGIPFHVVDYQVLFRRLVIDDFATQYAAGRTPNPCIRCNQRVKFGPLLRHAQTLGAARLATGHYARLARDGQRWSLRRGIDPVKDQSYFLFTLDQTAMAGLRFPVGELSKQLVRQRASSLGLPNAGKRESQELCFVDGDRYSELLQSDGDGADGEMVSRETVRGEIVDTAGRVLGRHRGVHNFTVGQRRGLRLGSRLAGSGAPLPCYVVALDAASRRVVVGGAAELMRARLTVSEVSWTDAPASAAQRWLVQLRSRHVPAWATVSPLGDRRAEICFEAPERAVAPGQAAVFYDGDEVRGGGFID